MPAAEIVLTVCSKREWSTYEFDCPECKDHVVKPADAHSIGLLRSAPVTERQWHIPAEALEEHSGGVITLDEVLDAHLWLDAHDALVDAL